QREYSCGHFRWIASKWCREYTITHKRCQPNVTHFEYCGGALCGECQPTPEVRWEGMIQRSNKHQEGAL
ncbi:hypothetical protein B0T22DRAFT_376861, partial [Podospora appendiculata]